MDAMPESKDDEGVLERQFNKKFIFQSSQDVSLPGLDKWFVDDDDGRALDPRLRMLKDELNQVRAHFRMRTAPELEQGYSPQLVNPGLNCAVAWPLENVVLLSLCRRLLVELRQLGLTWCRQPLL